MAPSRLLNRNVRPRRNVTEGEDSGDDLFEDAEHNRKRQRAHPSFSDEDDEDNEDDEPTDEHNLNHDDEDDSNQEVDVSHASDDENADDANDKVQHQLGNISFGALKQAQDSLGRKRKRTRTDEENNDQQESKLTALRARLDQLRRQKPTPRTTSHSHASELPTRDTSPSVSHSNSDSDSDSDSAPSEADATATSKSRSSKHAPTAQSSRYQVSRKRTVVDVPKRTTRDPRFINTTSSRAPDASNTSPAYDFLATYRASELNDLRTELKNPRLSAFEKQLLQNKINSLSNQLKAGDAKQREQAVVRAHRKSEREKAREQGKTPYYLKKSAVKELMHRERFDKMKAKDREKLLEKRRRREDQKEMKRLPRDRRVVG